MTTPNRKTRAQLETLLIAQLSAIRQYESNLDQQFKTNQSATAVSAQLLDLQRRAERLNRMIDAMNDISFSWDPTPFSVTA